MQNVFFIWFIKYNYIICGLQKSLPSLLTKWNSRNNDLKKRIDVYETFLPTYDTFKTKLKKNEIWNPIRNFPNLQSKRKTFIQILDI